MRPSVEQHFDGNIGVRRTSPSRTTFRAAMNRLAFATVVVVVTCIFGAICAGAALAAAFLSLG